MPPHRRDSGRRDPATCTLQPTMARAGRACSGPGRMFQTRSRAWEQVGTRASSSRMKAARRARARARRSSCPLLVGVLLALQAAATTSSARTRHATRSRSCTVVVLLILGWPFARDIGRRVGAERSFRRMDPATAGTVGFLIRLVTVGVTLLVALRIAGVQPRDPGRRRRVHRGRLRPRRPADARQPDRRDRPAQRAARSASATGSGCRPEAWPATSRAWSARSGCSITDAGQRRGHDHGPEQRASSSAGRHAAARARRGRPARPPAPRRAAERRAGAARRARITVPTRNRAPDIVLEEIDGDEVVVRIGATPSARRDGPQLADRGPRRGRRARPRGNGDGTPGGPSTGPDAGDGAQRRRRATTRSERLRRGRTRAGAALAPSLVRWPAARCRDDRAPRAAPEAARRPAATPPKTRRAAGSAGATSTSARSRSMAR